MFKIKLIISVLIFTSLLIITSIIKNQSRILEKQLYNLKSKVNFKEKNLSETQLDYFYLTSPSELEKRLTLDKFNEFEPIKHSKIFYDLNDFINIEKKLSNLKEIDEKKIQK